MSETLRQIETAEIADRDRRLAALKAENERLRQVLRDVREYVVSWYTHGDVDGLSGGECLSMIEAVVGASVGAEAGGEGAKA